MNEIPVPLYPHPEDPHTILDRMGSLVIQIVPPEHYHQDALQAYSVLVARSPWYALILKALVLGWTLEMTNDGWRIKHVGKGLQFFLSGELDHFGLPTLPDVISFEELRAAIYDEWIPEDWQEEE